MNNNYFKARVGKKTVEVFFDDTDVESTLRAWGDAVMIADANRYDGPRVAVWAKPKHRGNWDRNCAGIGR